MTGERTLSQLMEEFPPEGTSDEAAMHWLARVFELWAAHPHGEVFARRHEIAARIGTQYRLVPNPSMDPLANIVSGEPEAARRILVWGVTALIEESPGVISAMRHFYLVCVRRWKGEIEP